MECTTVVVLCLICHLGVLSNNTGYISPIVHSSSHLEYLVVLVLKLITRFIIITHVIWPFELSPQTLENYKQKISLYTQLFYIFQIYLVEQSILYTVVGRLSKCVVSYQYDMTRHMCLVNDTTPKDKKKLELMKNLKKIWGCWDSNS